MKTGVKKAAQPQVGARLVGALTELRNSLAAGKSPVEVFTSREYVVPAPPAFNAKAVQMLRERIGLSQALFAELVGASIPLVQAWEQGKRVPNVMARRLLAEMSARPQEWRLLAHPKSMLKRGA